MAGLLFALWFLLCIPLHCVLGSSYWDTAKSHAFGSSIPISANSLVSPRSQILYRYYSVPVCVPETIHASSLSFGQQLWGDEILTTSFQVSVFALIGSTEEGKTKKREDST
jgi:hypothetical protein